LDWGKPLALLIELLYETDHVDMAMSYNVATRSQFSKILFNNVKETLKILRNMGKN
jgi:hypothetical protein